MEEGREGVEGRSRGELMGREGEEEVDGLRIRPQEGTITCTERQRPDLSRPSSLSFDALSSSPPSASPLPALWPLSSPERVPQYEDTLPIQHDPPEDATWMPPALKTLAPRRQGCEVKLTCSSERDGVHGYDPGVTKATSSCADVILGRRGERRCW